MDWAPGPWRECGHAHGGCTCGQVWSIPADAPVATAIIGKWGDNVAVMRKVPGSRRKEPAIEMMEYGSVSEKCGKANARLIAAAPELYDALVETVGALIEHAAHEQPTIQRAQLALAKAALIKPLTGDEIADIRRPHPTGGNLGESQV